MRIVALGTSQFLVNCLRGLFESGCVLQAIITLPKELLPDNSIDLKDFSIEIGAEYFEIKDINSELSKRYIRSLSPDLIFSSWPKIIDSELLNIPVFGIIGTHPTALPYNKGRHPLQWSIALGLRESKLSFFKMDSGIDSGSIIMQVPYVIEEKDTISSLLDKLNTLAYSASLSLGKILISKSVPKGICQDTVASNIWRKRDRHDVLIDFRMNDDDILALIRSFSKPYPCASFIFENYYFNVISGETIEFDSAIPLEYFEPGYIIKVDRDFLFVKSSKKFLKLKLEQNIEGILDAKMYIYPPSKYLLKHQNLKTFFL